MIPTSENKSFIPPVYFKEIIPALFHPANSINSLAQKERSWITPMILLALFGGINTLISVIFVEKYNEYYYQPSSYVIIILLSIILSFVSVFSIIFIQYFLVSFDKNLITEIISVTAWACLPLAVRQIIRMAYMLTFSVRIFSPGLSGIINSANPTYYLTNIILEQLDVYLIWSLVNLYRCSYEYIIEPNNKMKIILTSGVTMVLLRGLFKLALLKISPPAFLFILFP